MIGYSFEECSKPVPRAEGFMVRITENVRRTVVFLGYEGKAGGPPMDCRATGFLVEHEGIGYLVTAKHVALALGQHPFWLRMNKSAGGSARLDADQTEWFFHENSNVDVACIPFTVPRELGFDRLYFPSQMIAENRKSETKDIGIGDITYTIGLFRRMAGKTRNFPVVHIGHIAALPSDEPIPVQDWERPNEPGTAKHIEGYLIESQSLQGLSGAPVLVRPYITLPNLKLDDDRIINALLPCEDGYLLGIWQGAWQAPPGEILAAETQGDRVPVGMGVVVPGGEILKLLDSSPVAEERAEAKRRINQSQIAVSDSALSTTENPLHKEDFEGLLRRAVRGIPDER